MRLMNSIEAGNTNSAQLQQYLTNGGIYSDFNGILQLPGQVTVLGASGTALSTINGSALASAALGASSVVNNVFSSNAGIRTTLQTSYRTLLGSLIGGSPSIWYPINTWTASAQQTNVAVTQLASLQYTGIAYGNGVFIAVANNSATPYISSDGVNWTAGGSMTLTTASAIAFGNIGGTNYWITLFAGLTGTSSVFNYSTNNGVSWTSAAMPSTSTWIAIAFANNTFVAIAGGSAVSTATAYSTTGTSFVAGGALPNSALWISIAGGLISATNYFVAVAGYSGNSTATAYSTNGGVTWASMTSASNAPYQSVAYGNSRFVAVSGGTTRGGVAAGSANSTVIYSTTGTSWVASSNYALQQWCSVIYVNGYFTSLNKTGGATARNSWSTDGITWNQATVLSNGGGSTSVSCAASSGTLGVYVDTSTTSSGATRDPSYGWTYYNTATPQISSNVAYGNGTWVVGFAGGYITSTDALNWTTVQNPYFFGNNSSNPGTSYTLNAFQWIGYLNGKWWALLGMTQNNSYAMYSTDLTNWSYVSLATGERWSGMANIGSTIVVTSSSALNPQYAGSTSATNNWAYSTNNGVSFTATSTMGSAGDNWGIPFASTNGYFYFIGGAGPQVYKCSATNPSGSIVSIGVTNLTTTAYAIATNGTTAVVAVNDGTWYTTLSGTGSSQSWTKSLSIATKYVTYYNGYYWAVPSTGSSIYYSTDGITWTGQSVSTGLFSGQQWYAGTGNNFLFLIANYNSNLTLGAPNL
jgi:hypothetical protein